ncbi:YihY/virulence factor BrkB family protein [Aidingimonas halophila]|uniref:Membrane protein n=1 Tax=Aidingimonas halophila TaxID=574349 RepID=A0A1H2ZFP7_9GAMM|nr:YihY/virulence factor BrkB family protein [Aidingimonas halophila]GHC15972.1 hypothetical protein GCM10008094_01290 [Aidingimonas halophila]SDX16313.1 membrane protein [Aidingimonas halophila]
MLLIRCHDTGKKRIQGAYMKDNERRQHGREAAQPTKIPRAGWRDILWRMRRELASDDITMLAAGVAFYALLALFPAIAALIALWALAFDPEQMAGHIGDLVRFTPPGAASIIRQQANDVGSNTDAGLSVTAILSLLIAIFIASKGIRGLIKGLNVVYGEAERRGFLRRSITVATLTVGLLIMTLVTIAFITLFPLVIQHLGLARPWVTVIGLIRWPVLLLVMICTTAVLYRFGPYRRSPRWEWVSPGTLLATVLWVLGSLGLSAYMRHFPVFNQVYGSLGAVVGLLLWFWLSAFFVLLGGKLNATVEHQTRHDTTVGSSRPMGKRGAYVADTLGEEHP